MKDNVLILGSSGFIGKNLAEQLDKNKYILLTPQHSELDVLDTEKVEQYFKSHDIDVVINAVVIGGSRKEEYEKNMLYDNMRVFVNLVRCEKYYKKLIHFGSGAEFDKSIPLVKIKESDFDRRVPADDYGIYKYICSQCVDSSEKIINLRLFGVYGKYEDYRLRFISNAICKNILNLPITIKQNVYFDYLYIDDLVKIVDYFLTHKSHYNNYNVGCGKKLDLLTIAKSINKISSKPSPIVIKSPGLQNEYTLNNARLKKEIKALRFTPFEQSLKELHAWYKDMQPKLNQADLICR